MRSIHLKTSSQKIESCIGPVNQGRPTIVASSAAAGALSATAELAPAAFPAYAVDAGPVISDTAGVPPAAFTAFSTAAGAGAVVFGVGLFSLKTPTKCRGPVSSGLLKGCQHSDHATAEELSKSVVSATTGVPSESNAAATANEAFDPEITIDPRLKKLCR